MKEPENPLSWNEVSLYRNEFDESVSNAAFDGVVSSTTLASASPEFGTDGAYAKCWRREKGTTYLYKSGSDTYEIEPLSEFLATQVADILCRNNVKYELTFYHRRLASRCKLFTGEQFGLAKMSTLPISNRRNPAALLKFAEQCYNQLHPSLILYKVVTMARIDVLYRNCLYGKQQIQRYWHQKFYSGIMQFH